MTIQSISAITPETFDLALLARQLRGALVLPGDADYDSVRAHWNNNIDRKPAMIVRCSDAQDVALAVEFAQRYDLTISVRSGGHNSAGLALIDGGMMIDLSTMKNITIDAERRTARAEPGVTLGEFVPAAYAYGLATTTGTCATVGLGGSTLGGGIGWLLGKHGMGVDNVLSMEVVTADGQILTASPSENTDLYWALRGGGGNFGIVTAIEMQLHPQGPVLGGMLIYPLEQAKAVLRNYRDFSASAPDEFIAYAVLATPPQIGPALILQVCYSGADLEEGQRVLAPLRSFGQPIADLINPMPYTDMFMMLTPPLIPGCNYFETAYSLVEPGDAAIDALVDCAVAASSPINCIVIHQVRGAATRVAPEATAFALREAHYAVVNIAGWMGGPAEPHMAWARESLAAMQPYASRGLYVNFMAEGRQDEIRDAYRANYARLAALKAVYDPANVFRRNQNIAPKAQS